MYISIRRIVVISMVGLLAACASTQGKERPVAESKQRSESQRFRDQAEYTQQQRQRDEAARVERIRTWKDSTRSRSCSTDSNGNQVCSGG
ncbi:hypothetical protein LAG73_18735 [Pseudoxanthomonas japonensis]|nr:hypothetical protein LAG73_18735 [Pseudoxanthomonas japonensis]